MFFLGESWKFPVFSDFDSHLHGHCGNSYRKTLNKYYLILCHCHGQNVSIPMHNIRPCTRNVSPKPIELCLVRAPFYLSAPTLSSPIHHSAIRNLSYSTLIHTKPNGWISTEAMNTNNYDVVIETMRIKQVQLTKSRHDPSYCHSISHIKTVFTLLAHTHTHAHSFGVRCLFNMIFTNTSHRTHKLVRNLQQTMKTNTRTPNHSQRVTVKNWVPLSVAKLFKSFNKYLAFMFSSCKISSPRRL